MKTALQATIDAMGAITLLNHAMSIYGLDRNYIVGFGGDPTKDEDTDRSPFVRVMDCEYPINQYSFDANGVITAHPFDTHPDLLDFLNKEKEEIDYEFYNNLGRINKGRALEDFDMFDRERETK
jgi:hypothetical protein